MRAKSSVGQMRPIAKLVEGCRNLPRDRERARFLAVRNSRNTSGYELASTTRDRKREREKESFQNSVGRNWLTFHYDINVRVHI